MLLYFMTVWNIFRQFDIIYSLLVQFVVIWYIFPFWYVWTKKNLATLLPNTHREPNKRLEGTRD
jgi:hypothetical protein